MRLKLTILLLFFLVALANNENLAQINNPKKQVVLQGFWWDYWNSNYPNKWANYLVELAPRLKQLGIDAVWIPPTIKNSGTNSVGYSPFDQYDLGDKFQKNSLPTRVGDKDELLRLVAVLKANGIDVIQDIVLNHVSNAGSASGQGGVDPTALDDGSTAKYKNFRYTCFKTPAQNESALNYLARQGRFPKNWQNFYPNNNNPCCSNDINSPFWGPDISYESTAFGLSSNATFNPPQSADYMRNGIRNWMIWYKKQVGFDGVRMDAVKHFPAYVSEDVLWNLQYGSLWANGGNDMYAVGEWVGGANELDNWANAVQNRAGTFDFSLRNALTGIISGNGNYNLGNVPAAQQSNRERTVPFVNNHDTYRPILSATGNYTGWNSGSQLGTQIEPNDPRSSMVHAIAFAVDGAPQLFFEDLFNIGYNGNRFNHQPSNPQELPTFSDIENILWCHQNLHFKEGSYLVRWQANDALVIERSSKAIIAVTDNYSTWQNLTGVQTSWSDGTVLKDYSGAHGNSTIIVYGGGKIDISIPPCDGSAPASRKGYCIYAPDGIQTNYLRPSKITVQEWEMSDDLGDSHTNSLQQGGALPSNSLDCRVVGRVYLQQGEQLKVEVYPESPLNGVVLSFVDKACDLIDSSFAIGNFSDSIVASYSGWHTIKIKNLNATQATQKCWVKAIYKAPSSVTESGVKNKCACSKSSTATLSETFNGSFKVYPNPVQNLLYVDIEELLIGQPWEIYSIEGKLIHNGVFDASSTRIDLVNLNKGSYYIKINQSIILFVK
jgi:alpha-amylase